MGILRGDISSCGEFFLADKWTRRLAKIELYLENTLLNAIQTRDRSIFSLGLLPNGIYKKINRQDCDVVHLHWVQNSFIPFHNFARIQQPLVMTIHDTWTFTGGCHYPRGCEQYTAGCAQCPHMEGLGRWLIPRVLKMKKRAYSAAAINFITPSKAFFDMARSSSLLAGCQVHHIPYAINTAVYAPLERELARKLLDIDQEGPVLLFGAVAATSDHRKGYDLLLEALRRLPMYFSQPLRLLVFGASSGEEAIGSYPIQYLGALHDDLTLRAAYASADVFVCPSREDNLPNTVLESLACGTPVAAFSVGGIPDMVEDGVNGSLAAPEDADALARSIAAILNDTRRSPGMREAARKTVTERYSMPRIARKHMDLYADILAARGA